MAKAKTSEQFIEEAKKIHGNKYNYSKTVYINNRTKVCIICPEHGEFLQSPKGHLNGNGCKKCSNIKLSNNKHLGIDEFICRAKEIHGDNYNYSKAKYINLNTKICIVCSEHGDFLQTPNSHLKGCGCPKCANKYMDEEYFKEKGKSIHNDKYNYSKVKYVNSRTKVCIICPEHGEFWQTPHSHLTGYGCKKCSENFLDKDFFIKKSIKLHGGKYDYSKVEYKNNKSKVIITCPEHGDFLQVPNSHLSGRGCPKCKQSHLERDIENILRKKQINSISQYHNQEIFDKQSLDFYLPDYNIGIECQGEQHFKDIFYKNKRYNDSKQQLLYVQELDKRKKRLCKENDIHLIYYVPSIFIKYMDKDDIYFSDTEELINYIKNFKNMS